MSTRPKFREETCLDGQLIAAPLETEDGTVFTPIVSCRAYFAVEFFQAAFQTLVDHPEYNSSLILRSETLCDHYAADQTYTLKDHLATTTIHRRLLPRRPTRDGPLEQTCTLYQSTTASHHPDSHPTVGVLTPQLPPDRVLPYYHPSVSHLAFRYISIRSSRNDNGDDDPDPTHTHPNHLIVEIIPLNSTTTPTSIDISSRLYRTCLALLETIDRYGWGAATNYKKRVIHDVIIPRDEYQDLYLVMKERHKALVGCWKESTDPCKHVFEDVGIATFLMLLWKKSYNYVDHECYDPERPWTQWPRPPEGFIDLGCGNGILTHILLSEGYKGEGIDIRPRNSWSSFPQSTQTHLHIEPFNPFTLPTLTLTPARSHSSSDTHLRPHAFIIGNHADELTPWIPVISTLLPASGYLSIPCCPWDFDARFERGSGGAFAVPQFDNKSSDHREFVGRLGFGEAQGDTSYSVYRVWLAYLSRACGWIVECEMLRIPSTRNWAIIGRTREGELEGLEVARNIVEAVRERGIFAPRIPEGKCH